MTDMTREAFMALPSRETYAIGEHVHVWRGSGIEDRTVYAIVVGITDTPQGREYDLEGQYADGRPFHFGKPGRLVRPIR